MKDLTVIIPIHIINDDVLLSLEKAIQSIEQQINCVEMPQVFCILTKEILDEIQTKLKCPNINDKLKFIINEGETDFCSQINLGVSKCLTKYFSILEFDDMYAPKWFSNASKYIDNDPSIDICLPLNEYRNNANGELISFGNEVVWANSFSNEMGVIDSDCLEAQYDFNMTGGIFNTSDFINIGGLKPSIKISFWYEFLLRATYKGFKIYVVPKFGYVHFLNRKGSLMSYYSETISEKEGVAWYNLAKREYPFKEDRKKEPNMDIENNELNELK